MSRVGRPTTVGVEEKRSIQSVDISLQILQVLSNSDSPLSLKAISDTVGLPSSNVHRYLASFVKADFVDQDKSSGFYHLGKESMQLGLSALKRYDVVERAGPVLDRLTVETQTTSVLTVWSEYGATVVRIRKAAYPIIAHLAHGFVYPATSSATGQVFLAFLPRSLTQKTIDQELGDSFGPDKAGRTRAAKDLDSMLKSIRETGMAWLDSPIIPGFRNVSAPVINPDGDAMAAITLLGMSPNLSNPNHEIVRLLKEACEQLSACRD